MKKIAVVLFNLGGPDNLRAIRPFLANLFGDPAIIRLPAPFRKPLAALIALRRAKTARGIYAALGGRSPILVNTQAQARALERELAGAGEARCFVCMRYWHPLASETARAVKEFAPDEIVLLPLYPQFSTATTASSLKAWDEAARAAGLDAPTKAVCCYPDEPGFIKALAQSARVACDQAKPFGAPRLLFSAHGLPEKIIRAGDPYQSQCERTTAALARELGPTASDRVLCYQSRVGPLKWIGPSIEEEIRRAGSDGVPVVVVPIAFVCENSETLYDIDIACRGLAAQAGVPYFTRAPAVGAAPEFVEGLANMVRKALRAPDRVVSSGGARICPPGFSGCCMEEKRENRHAL